MKQYFPGVYELNNRPHTRSAVPGTAVYGENLVRVKGAEYRMWDPFRSKLAAGIMKGLSTFPFARDTNVLYLGASSGTTASHLADVCTGGRIYCVESSSRMMRELLPVCARRRNMVPVLADAMHPRRYAGSVPAVDVVYQDVAQPNQADILRRNIEVFHPKTAFLAIKARSINAVRSPKKVFKAEVGRLREHYPVIEEIKLPPFEKDHILVVVKP